MIVAISFAPIYISEYIPIKIGNKIIIKENLFKKKNRIAIQKSAVSVSLKTIDKII